MISYLMKSAACAVVFLLLYKFFLEKEKMHRFNRAYLLVSVVFSFIIPSIHIPVVLTEETFAALDTTIPVVLFDIPNNIESNSIITAVAQPVDYTLPVLLSIYFTIAGSLFIRFVCNIYKLTRLQKNSQVFYNNGVRFIIVEEEISSYTFLNTIFLGRKDYGNLHGEILTHELTHIRQKHSLDIVFIELVRIIFWFNPIYIFYKRSIQLNHEFLADEAVIQKCTSVSAYQHLLLDRIGLASHIQLGSRFNYSITKKRLQMMTKKSSHARAMMKQFALLPAVIVCCVVFSTRTMLSAAPLSGSNQIAQQDTIKKKGAQPVTDTKLLKDVPFTKEGISVQEYEEYLSIQKKYVDLTKSPKEKRHVFQRISDENHKRLQSLFLRMTREQQTSVVIRFMKQSGPFGKEPPSDAQIEKWKNPNLYGLWINEKKVNNSELSKYTAADFSHYYASKLYGAAKTSVKYHVQIDLMTNNYFAEYRKKSLQSIKDNPYRMVIIWVKKPAS